MQSIHKAERTSIRVIPVKEPEPEPKIKPDILLVWIFVWVFGAVVLFFAGYGAATAIRFGFRHIFN